MVTLRLTHRFLLLSLLLTLSALGGCLPAVFTPTVTIDSTLTPDVRTVNYREGARIDLQLAASDSALFGPTDTFVFYLGNQTYRAEAGQGSYIIAHDELPKDGQIYPAGYRLFNEQDQLIAQDEISVKLLF